MEQIKVQIDLLGENVKDYLKICEKCKYPKTHCKNCWVQKRLDRMYQEHTFLLKMEAKYETKT